MIEADVSLDGSSEYGAHICNKSGEDGSVIMAHPPDTVSDLSLALFMDTVIKSRKEGRRKGVKLDFKFIEVVEPSLQLIRKLCEHIDFPIWINADILGMEAARATPVNATEFLHLAKTYLPTATLSVGYTTVSTGKFVTSNFDEMLGILNKNQVTAPVTLPLRASLLANSKPEILQFFKKTNLTDSSITIWSSE